MKKITILAAIAAVTGLASCTAQAPKANLKTELDSLSYSIGMAQTQGLKGYLVGRMGDCARDGSQLRPFIVWFGEAVPMIEAAIDIVEKADVFVIIGTSMNVYPAAGLLNYVPRTAEVYLIDPKPVDTHTSRSIHIIQKGASEGVVELKHLLGL